MTLGIDIQYELRYYASFITGVLGAVQPLNDIFLLMIIFLTDKSSFRGDREFFAWMTAYIPLILVLLNWFGSQSVTVWTNSFYEFPFAEMLMSTLSFSYMVWPTLFVAAHNFV